ncbi:MAG: hypothetical protein R3253_05770 [Longimicrobiales bacterium]|nr:hypothetical protein [Longimicrobiales bacterium]
MITEASFDFEPLGFQWKLLIGILCELVAQASLEIALGCPDPEVRRGAETFESAPQQIKDLMMTTMMGSTLNHGILRTIHENNAISSMTEQEYREATRRRRG